MSAPAVYLIPGLGADHRVFRFLDLPGFQTTILHWEQPHKREPLKDYVRRMAAQVHHEAPVFIGYSLGGIIGAELLHLFPGSRLIMIASFAEHKELPWWLRLCGAIRLNRLLSGEFMKRRNAFARWFFSLRNDQERQLFDEILQDSDPRFIEWAVDELLHWKGTAHARLHHIHGRKDRLLPCRFTSADIFIEDGGHFMIVSHGNQISQLLIDQLSKLRPAH